MDAFTKLAPRIRWLIRRDLTEVYEIENRSFEFPWGEEDFLRCLRQRNCIGMVAEHNERVIGFVIYELHKNRLHILNFGVHPEFRRRGVGAVMVDKLKSKLTATRRNRLMLETRETNVAGQLFWRSQGFRAISVLRNFYEEPPDEDAYLFSWKLEQPAECAGA